MVEPLEAQSVRIREARPRPARPGRDALALLAGGLARGVHHGSPRRHAVLPHRYLGVGMFSAVVSMYVVPVN